MYLLLFLTAKSNIHETFPTNYIKCIFENLFRLNLVTTTEFMLPHISICISNHQEDMVGNITNQGNFVYSFVLPQFTYKYKRKYLGSQDS